MKTAKRALSVLLAFMMVFGTFGMIGSAASNNAVTSIEATGDATGKITFGLNVLKDGVAVSDGATLSPGDVVDVQLLIGTDFYCGFLQTEVLYDSTYFEPYLENAVYETDPGNTFKPTDNKYFIQKLETGAPKATAVNGNSWTLFDTVLPAASGGYNGLVNKASNISMVKSWMPLYTRVEVNGQKKQANDVAPEYASLHFVGLALTMGPDADAGGYLIKIPYAPYFSFQLRVKDNVTTDGDAKAAIFVPIGGAKRAAKNEYCNVLLASECADGESHSTGVPTWGQAINCADADLSFVIDEHVHNYVLTDSKDATCTEPGYKTYTCQNEGCPDPIKTTDIPAGHSFTNYVSDENATCTADGTKTAKCDRCDVTDTIADEGSALGHDWSEWTKIEGDQVNHIRYCSRCDATETAAHEFDMETTPATCTTDGVITYTCADCGYRKEKILPALGHDRKTTVLVNATCAKAGYKTTTCTRCGDVNTEMFERLPHQYNAVVTAPTSTRGGYTTYTCSMCGRKVTAHETPPTGSEVYTLTYNANGGTVQQQATYSKTYSNGGTITKYTPVRTGYTFIEWYPTLPTRMPDRDLTVYAVWKPEHAHDTVILNQQAPTCDATGSTGVVYCATCNEVIDYGAVIPATGHAWDKGAVTTEATCTADGVRTYTCKVCSTTREETIPAWGHCYDNGLIIVDPTCVDEGEKLFTCAACGLTYTEPVPANGHSYNSGAVTTDPTCTVEGVKTFTCTVCGATRTEPVAALGHNYTFAIETLPTCTVDGVMRYTCTRCGDTYTNPINAAHKYNAVRTEPTCTEDGAITYTCTVCGDSYADPIEKLGHTYKDTVTAPTCTAKGYTTHTCTRCGNSYTSDETDMIPHTYGDWEWNTEPTMDTDGLLVKTCTVCGDRVERVVEKTYLRFEVLEDEETGQEYAVVTGLQETYPDKIIVPAELAGVKVTEIEEGAFLFYGEEEDEPSGYSFSEAVIFAQIEELKEGVFGYCRNLHSVTLPDSVKSIGLYAFYECAQLPRIELPEQVESIGDMAFAYCVNLQQVTLPQGLKSIGSAAFGRCKSMQQITLPDGIEYLGEAVFAQSGLLELTIPASLAEVEGVEFAGCPRMTAFHVDPANPSLMVIDGVLFDKTGKRLVAFPMGRGDTEYTVPDGVETIGTAAFDYVVGDEDVHDAGFVPTTLQTVRLPSSLKAIGEVAFYGLTQMHSIDIPDGVTEIGEAAFAECIGLKRVTIPAGIQTIGALAFDECDALQAVCYAGTSTSWNRISIGNYNDVLKNARRYYHRHDQASATLTGKIDPTCTSEGYTGSYTFECGFVLGGGEVIPALGHTYRTETTAPTCEANGYTTYICTRCGSSYMDDIVDATGHDYMVTKHKDATCTESGYDIYNCKNDPAHTYTETIPAKGHDYKTETVAPTCEAKGYTTHTCSRCKDSYVTDEKAAIGHAWDSGKVTKAATCTEAGIKTFTCTHDSSHTYTEPISATGHSFGAWTQTTAPTVYAEGVEKQYCANCTATNTRSIPKLPMPKVNIQNFTASSKAYDYRSSITFKADVDNKLPGGQIHWFVDGKEVGTGNTYTAENVKQSFSLQAKYYVDGKEIPEAATEVEKVNVNTGFFAKLKAFFRGLFGRLPKIVQEYLGAEIIDRIFVN